MQPANVPPSNVPPGLTDASPRYVEGDAALLGRDGGPVEVGDGGDLDRPPSPAVSPDSPLSLMRELSVAQLQRGLHCIRNGGSCLLPPNAAHVRIPRGGRDRLAEAGWITVLAAHPGAGATTVATALSEAAATQGLGVDLIEVADPTRSGLASAATAELDADPTAGWRRGRRGDVTLYRRTESPPGLTWPSQLAGDCARLAVVDLSAAAPAATTASTYTSTAVVLVARATVPGATALEALVARSDHQSLIVVVIGPRRWPHPVSACLGPYLRALRDTGRLITMPWDRHVAVTGITSSPLPTALTAAAGCVLDLVPVWPGDATPSSPAEPPTAAPVEDGPAGRGRHHVQQGCALQPVGVVR